VALLVEPASCDPRGRCLAPADIALLRQTYTLLAAELGVPVLEIEGPWPTEWYADPAHFNREGTAAYTTRLAAALKELGL
jgi:lysophospholipase L1-like esterase